MAWSAMKFKFGDRVVVKDGGFMHGEAGVVLRVHDESVLPGYGVKFDNPEFHGPFGDGGVFMDDDELEFEEETQ